MGRHYMQSYRQQIFTYTLLMVVGMVLFSAFAYLNTMQYLTNFTPKDFLVPAVMGGLTGFGFASFFLLKKTNTLLEQSRNDYKLMTDNVSGKFALYQYRARDEEVTYISKGSEVLLGKKPEEIVGQKWYDVCGWDEANLQKNEILHIDSSRKNGKIYQCECHTDVAGGKRKYWSLHEYNTINRKLNEIMVNGIIEDVTIEREEVFENKIFKKVFSHLSQAIVITDTQGSIIYVNKMFSQITGYSEAEITGDNLRILQSGKYNQSFYIKMWNSLILKKSWHGDIWNRKKSGELYCQSLMISALDDDHGVTTHFVGLFQDVTEKKIHEEGLKKNLHHDPLTKLPNRSLLIEKLEKVISESQSSNSLNCLVFIDLDEFKSVNDTHGHKAGDYVLKEIAHRINQLVRTHDTVARFGGDEFIVLLEAIAERETVETIIQRILDEIDKPIHFKESALHVSASIGFTVYQGEVSVSSDDLINRADNAMYKAKKNGKGRYEIYKLIS